MSPIRHCLALVAVAALAGCANLTLAQAPQLGAASLQLRPQVSPGGYRTQAQGLLPYGQVDVAHLVLKLYTVQGGSESAVLNAGGDQVSKDIAKASLGDPVGFYNLHPNTTYRVKAYAYKADTLLASDLISHEASSSLDVVVGTSEHPVVSDLRVQLVDRPFGAEATSSIVFTEGGYTDSTESIEPQPQN